VNLLPRMYQQALQECQLLNRAMEEKAQLTRTELVNLCSSIARVETLLVHLYSIGSNSQGSSNRLRLGTGSGHVESEEVCRSVELQVEIAYGDCRIVAAI
jgi:hypothetical protein